MSSEIKNTLNKRNLSLLGRVSYEKKENDACEREEILREERKELNKNINKIHADCELSKYTTIYKYFNTERKSTFKDLLNALMIYYKENKLKDTNFRLSFEEFIDMFEKDTMKIKNFKKQHVFEALCKILLMFDYDDGELGRNKQFYSSLENFVKNPNNPNNVKQRENIINEDINVSSEGGVVDIFFKTETINNDNNCEWMCDCNDSKKNELLNHINQEYILIQNKYYSKEKSDIKNYDVTKIYAKAQSLYESKERIIPKIVLMVNNSQSLSDKLSRSRDASKGLISKIYGVYEIDKWFNLLLYDLYNSTSIDEFLAKRGAKSKIKPKFTPRFHQIYFTEATLKYHQNEDFKKFIWGAVPRSGKSYMIGNMISKRRNERNDVVIILGAKTETESQFIKMFCDFADYSEYGIIKTSVGKMENIKNCENLNQIKEKNIYVFSQEWFKNGKIVSSINEKLKNKSISKKNYSDDTSEFTEDVLRKYSDLLRNGNKIDLYFDEIHKGGSTDNSENILNAFNNAGVKIDIFIMVTATFAKPNIKYRSNFIDEKEAKILEWSYEDQQIMKYIKNETKMDMMINSRKGLERDVMREIFEKYYSIYGNDFLDILSSQFSRHPELVLLQPYNKIKDINLDFKDIFNSNLKCNACLKNQSLEELRNPSNVFYDYNRIQKLFELLAGTEILNGRKKLSQNSVYGYLKQLGAPDHSERHSELWFLPDSDLYVNPEECRSICSENKVKQEDNHNEDSIDNKIGLPNIEPLTRGLAFSLMENDFFRDNYNVLIVHNTKIDFKDKNNNRKISYNDIFKDTNIGTTIDSKNLSETIKEFETQTYRDGKNLIILTGAKLRLGISLPCVDIGFNFDNIQSVDVNYQTMFRVLTERYNKPKNYGFYVDFNKERFINFLYDYNATYSSAKNISKLENNIYHLQGLLLLFNVNGFGMRKLDEREELKMYNKLTNELELNINGYTKYYSDYDNMSKLFKKSLIDVDIKDLIFLKNLINKDYNFDKPKNIKKTLKEGEKYTAPVYRNSNTEDDERSDDNVEELKEENNIEIDSNATIMNIITDLLPRIVALLALFSKDEAHNCDNLNECILNSIEYLKNGENICNCDNIKNSHVLSCYFNNVFFKRNLSNILEIIQKLINNPNYIQLRDTTNFIFNNIREMVKDQKGLIYSMSPNDIQKKIEQYLPVREEKKNKNGEVFTPVKLIEEMIDQIPDRVWKNPELKWLDPANGIGNFPMVVYKKLLETLPDQYEGQYGRYHTIEGKKNHIINKMLYMIEIDPANVKISRKIFGSSANICCTDFLENYEKCFTQFGINKFDIIMGNPPFQMEQEGKRKGGYGGRTLWDKFIIKSLDILLDKGFLCFITPSGWRKPEHELFDIMTQNNQLVYLHIIGKREGQQLFNVTQRFDLYIIEKKPKYKNTIIIDELGNQVNLNLSEWLFLPNYEYNNIKKIMTDENNGIDVIYSSSIYDTRKLKNNKTEEFKYPVVHSINQDGMVFWYTDDKTKGHFGKPKVLLNFNEQQYPVNDYEGKYGMSQITFGIPINSKKQGDDIIKAINTDEFKEIIKATKWAAFQTDWRMFKYLKPDFYKYFLKENAGLKIKKFITKKHRQGKSKTKKTNGGYKKTKRRNNVLNKTMRR
jgi:adenine-specific DNA-methyltransferase